MATSLTRGLRGRFDALRRDLGMIADQLAGKPPPTVQRPAGPRRARARRVNPLAERALRVVEVRRLTPDAVAVALEAPDGAVLDYRAGQFLRVGVDVDGATVWRPYSFSSAPGDGAPTLGIKRVPGGRVSPRLVDGLRAGDRLRVTGPSGAFTVDATPDAARHLVLVAGGSGITPLLSLARQTLAAEPGSRVTLIYGNRAVADVMFRGDLDALAAAHPGRMVVDHVLHDPATDWDGPTGLLDGATLAGRLDALGVADDATTLYLLCGPAPMRDAARARLGDRGVAPDRIREERFVDARGRDGAGGADTAATGAARRGNDRPETLTVRAPDGTAGAALVRPGQTLLEAGLAAGLPLPFSCTMGGCGACRVRLVAGEVDLVEPHCLRSDERAAGYVLACSSRPRGPVTVEVEA